MRRSTVWTIATRLAGGGVDRLIGLDPKDPNERFARPPPPVAPLWFFNPAAWAALGLIAIYCRIRPRRSHPVCRFTPSCSVYMSLSIRKYGVRRGIPRGLHRIRRCSGFVPHGEDWP
jgi:putative component of membrane protein insertase Oxa1/YidC/SpoIIIJ protein YidD